MNKTRATVSTPFFYCSLSPLRDQASIPRLSADRIPKAATPYRLISTTAIATMATKLQYQCATSGMIFHDTY
jgi:hypothetical protein